MKVEMFRCMLYTIPHPKSVHWRFFNLLTLWLNGNMHDIGERNGIGKCVERMHNI